MTRLTDTLEVPAGTIAVGVDGSSGSDAALRAAVATAVGEHRSLTIVHAVGSAPESPLVLTDARAAAERQAPGLAVHLVLRVADPRDVLVGVSEDAAMVVVGSRGRGPTRTLPLGSVSLAVTRRASCPVVVVRPHHPGRVRHGILVAADGSPGVHPHPGLRLPAGVRTPAATHRPGSRGARTRRRRGARAPGGRGVSRATRASPGRAGDDTAGPR